MSFPGYSRMYADSVARNYHGKSASVRSVQAWGREARRNGGLVDGGKQRAQSLPKSQIAIEVPHGLVVETLLERGFKVHAINPKIASATGSLWQAQKMTAPWPESL